MSDDPRRQPAMRSDLEPLEDDILGLARRLDDLEAAAGVAAALDGTSAITRRIDRLTKDFEQLAAVLNDLAVEATMGGQHQRAVAARNRLRRWLDGS